MINVWGDSVGAGIVAKLSRKKLERADHEVKLEVTDDKVKVREDGIESATTTTRAPTKRLTGALNPTFTSAADSWEQLDAAADANYDVKF